MALHFAIIAKFCCRSSTWTTPAPVEKNEDCEEDSDGVDEGEKDERSSLKKEDSDFTLPDDLPWLPAGKDLSSILLWN